MAEDKKLQAIQLQHDGLAAVKQQISTAKHVLEFSTCTVSTAVVLHHHSWNCPLMSAITRFGGKDCNLVDMFCTLCGPTTSHYNGQRT